MVIRNPDDRDREREERSEVSGPDMEKGRHSEGRDPDKVTELSGRAEWRARFSGSIRAGL